MVISTHMLKLCNACGKPQDELGFKQLGGIEICTACQIDMEVNLADIMRIVDGEVRRTKEEDSLEYERRQARTR